ncbi:MAG: hypothetical protein D6711_12920 [Chloroflexi bacterium]|nr:MAG: hypothetical protein D6711_12920 [Chloroflexota bacterium]
MKIIIKRRSPCGIASVDSLAGVSPMLLNDYIVAASDYVMQSIGLTDSQKKRAQIQLGDALARLIAQEVEAQCAESKDLIVGEKMILGALRGAQSDVTSLGETDGVRLAVEIKPVYLAVGRAIWNRFGDIRSFAVNVHLKFPFAVVGGIMPLPTIDWYKDRGGTWQQRSTTNLIDRLCRRFDSIGMRRNDGDPVHALEAVCVLAFDPNTQSLHPHYPGAGSFLQFNSFIQKMAEMFESRFVY